MITSPPKKKKKNEILELPLTTTPFKFKKKTCDTNSYNLIHLFITLFHWLLDMLCIHLYYSVNRTNKNILQDQRKLKGSIS